jgi:hypothetical protein
VSGRFCLRLAVIVALGLVVPGIRGAGADLYEDHLQDWGNGSYVQEALQQGVVSFTTVGVCPDYGLFPLSTQAAVNRWNAALGRTVCEANCGSPQVWVTTDGFNDPRPTDGNGCGGYGDACTTPSATYTYPWPDWVLNGEELHNPIWVRLRPGLSGTDGTGFTNFVVTHELGHVLSHADYFYVGTCPTPTVMDSNQWCYSLQGIDTPQPFDVANYNQAYKPNGGAAFSGSSPGVGQAQLSWNPSGVHAEAIFRVNRWPRGQGCCGTEVATAAKNAWGTTLSSQPYGRQTYRVRAWTYALGNGYGDDPTPADVTVVVRAPDDYDADGFTDSRESYLGTDPYDDCRDNSSDDAWPLDIVIDGTVTVAGDVLQYRNRIGATRGPPPSSNWRQRLDLDQSGLLSVVGDVLKFAGKIGAVCYND